MPDLKSIIHARSLLKTALREFFEQRDFIEADTPVLVPCPGTELHLDYFQTHWVDHHRREHTLWMRSSPELALKKLLAEGIPALYQIAPSFRNVGEIGPWHHPEFTMLEYYQVGSDWNGFLDLSCELIRYSAKKLSTRFPCSFSPQTQAVHMSVREAFSQFAGLDLIDQDPELAKKARAQGVLSIQGHEDFETAFFKILIEKVEPAFQKIPWVILSDYPASQAALARVEGAWAKRFEFYLHGIELSNGFYELCDLSENQKRIREVHEQRKILGKSIPNEDEAFYTALAKGLPECFGNALGFDRLLAIILGYKDLGAVLPFRREAPYSLYT